LVISDASPSNVADFVALKTKNPTLKMLVSMGSKVDSNDGTNKYSKLVSSSANIAAFSSKVLTFLSKYGFDGLDVNWQYPSSPADQLGFYDLITALRSALNPRG